MAWTVDELLAAMKRKANLPAASNAKFTDPELLTIAYEVLITGVDPILTNLREEYGVTREDFAITSGDATYVLPERAISGTIRQVLYVSPAGLSSPLVRIAESETWQYEGTTAAVPLGYAIEDDVIRLLPAPADANYTLRIKYRRRPSRLVLTSACHILTFLPAGLVVTTSGAATVSGEKDLVRARPPFGLCVQSGNATAAGAGVVTFTFTDTPATAAGLLNAQVGDYVCIANTTCIVPVPERFQTLLLDLATAQVLQEWGDREGAAIIWDSTNRYVASLRAAQSNRVETAPQLVIQGGSSALRGAFGSRWRSR